VTHGCRYSRSNLLRLYLLPVVLNEVKLLSMTIAGIEIVLPHFSVDLVIVPVIVIETVYGAHHSGAMPPTRAVHVKLAGSWIISNLQKRAYLVGAGIFFVNNGNVHVTHPSSLNGGLFAVTGIVSQVNDCLDTKFRKISKVLGFWSRTAVKLFIHLAEIANLNVGELALMALCKGNSREREDEEKSSYANSGKPCVKSHFFLNS
jgi:hypothetical protein